MSRLKLIKQLKEKNPQLNQLDLKTVVNVFSECISNTLKNGDNVEIRGLGRWYCKKLKENYNMRNPANNKSNLGICFLGESKFIGYSTMKRLFVCIAIC